MKSLLDKARALGSCLLAPSIARQGPLSMNVEIGNACNLDCVMCERASFQRPDAAFTLEEFQTLYAGVRAPLVALHGYGEPLMQKSLIPILNHLSREGARTSITSNLIPLRAEQVHPLILSGLGLLKVSVDSHIPATYRAIRGQDALERVVRNILMIEEARRTLGRITPEIRVSYTIQPANYRELPDFVTFCRETLKQNMAFFQLLLFRNTLLADRPMGELDKEEFRATLQEAARRAHAVGLRCNLPSLARNFDRTWAFYEIAEVVGNRVVCPKPWLTTFIAANGDVKPCDILGLSDTIMGNVKEQPFREIWNSPPYQEFRRRIAARDRPNAVCRECKPMNVWQTMQYALFAPKYLRG